MSNLVWTENTRPDRPGIWMLQGSKNAITVYERDLSHDWFVGSWCFICDLPTIVDPPKYREVRKGDEGESIEVRNFGKHFLVGFYRNGDVVYENEHGFLCRCPREDARILDDGQPKCEPREWWILRSIAEPKLLYAYDSEEKARGSHTKHFECEVIDEPAS